MNTQRPTCRTLLPSLHLGSVRMCLAMVFLVAQLVPHFAIADDSNLLNVVFILADDLGWAELGCYGQQKIPTPHLDALAKQGMRFTQHYSGAPVCAPSRCVLMTGKHLGHAEIRGNMQAKVKFPEFSEGQIPISAEVSTLAMTFQQAGYRTAAMGKWGLGPVGSSGDPNRKGFDLFYGYNCQAVAHSYFPSHLWRNKERIEINSTPISGYRKQPTGPVRMDDWLGQSYAPSLMVAEAEKFLDEQKSSPFFLFLPFIEPHVAMQPPKAAVETFPETWDNEPYRGENGYLPHPRPRAAYAAMIAELDRHVGRIMAALDKNGLNDRTLVIFTSDNGATHPGQANPNFHIGGADPRFFNSTADLRGYKGSVYEGGLRVPMICRLPGKIPQGVTNDSPTYFADWFPTLCQAADIRSTVDFDGESFWSSLTTGQSFVRQKPMVWVFPEYGGQVAVRIGDYKIVRRNLMAKQIGSYEVYDLANDRSESNNLAASRADLIQQAHAILLRETSENTNFPVPIPDMDSN